MNFKWVKHTFSDYGSRRKLSKHNQYLIMQSRLLDIYEITVVQLCAHDGTAVCNVKKIRVSLILQSLQCKLTNRIPHHIFFKI